MENDMPALNHHHGYIAGVFDLLHVGHLNILEAARQRCNMLTVGVLTDSLVRFFKTHQPVIPELDRLRMVSALRCVDHALLVDHEKIDKVAIHELLGFDCLFSGSDYQGLPHWSADAERLRERGADLIYLPYTEGVSTTSIINRAKTARTPNPPPAS